MRKETKVQATKTEIIHNAKLICVTRNKRKGEYHVCSKCRNPDSKHSDAANKARDKGKQHSEY